MIVSTDPLPHVADELMWLKRRLAKLVKIEGQAENACQSIMRIRRHGNLRIRMEFARRTNPAEPNGDLIGRLLPPRNERPPATRLVSPRGVALKLYLTVLFNILTR